MGVNPLSTWLSKVGREVGLGPSEEARAACWYLCVCIARSKCRFFSRKWWPNQGAVAEALREVSTAPFLLLLPGFFVPDPLWEPPAWAWALLPRDSRRLIEQHISVSHCLAPLFSPPILAPPIQETLISLMKPRTVEKSCTRFSEWRRVLPIYSKKVSLKRRWYAYN